MNLSETMVGEHVRTAAGPIGAIGRRAFSIPSTWTLAVGFLVAALALDLYRLGAPALWFDEALSVSIARGPLAGLLYTFPAANMDVYYTVLYGWVHLLALLGLTTAEFLARLPSAIFGALSVVIVYLLGRRFVGHITGIVAAIVYLLDSYQLTAAQTARSYSLQLLLVCVAWYAWFTLLSRDSGRCWWVWYVLASALAALSQVMAIFSLLAQGVVFVGLLIVPGPWRTRAWSRLPGMCLSLVLIGGLIAPALYASQSRPVKTSWVPVPRLDDIRHLYVAYLDSNNSLSFWALLAVGAVALLLAVLPRPPWRGRQPGHISGTVPDSATSLKSPQQIALLQPVGLTLIVWLTVPVVASYVVSHISPNHVFSQRYLVEILPALCLLIGLGVQMFPGRVAQIAVTLGLAGAILISVPQYYANAQIEDLRTPTQWFVQHYQPGDGLICHFRTNVAACPGPIFHYYLYDLHADQIVSDAASTSPSTASLADVAEYAAQHARLFYFAGDYSSATDLAQAQATQAWLDSHYQLVAQMTTTYGTVCLYATGAAVRPISCRRQA
jgi:4-amino-4-deoxy-L-arabinose transferase-like glycosyltransferase